MQNNPDILNQSLIFQTYKFEGGILEKAEALLQSMHKIEKVCTKHSKKCNKRSRANTYLYIDVLVMIFF